MDKRVEFYLKIQILTDTACLYGAKKKCCFVVSSLYFVINAKKIVILWTYLGWYYCLQI